MVGSKVDYNQRRKELNVGDTYSMKQDRLVAVGDSKDFSSDKLLNYMTSNAETLFKPKKILADGDWLLSYKEGRQTYKWYADGNGGHKWIGGQR